MAPVSILTASPIHHDGHEPLAPPNRVVLFGLPIDDLTLPQTLDRVDAMIAAGGVHQHVAVNVSKAVQASKDPEMARIIAACDVVGVDGQPIVWASRLVGRPLRARVPGIDLMFGLIERAAARGHRVYFLGARPDVVERVVARARREHPGLVLAGHRDGYWRPEEEPAVVDGIAASSPDILFVAIGSPAKERFLASWKEAIGAGFVMGVGGSFDVYAGVVSRAPRWVQRLGFEWAYRVFQEPRRLWRRYAVDAPAFAVLVVRELAARRRRRSRLRRR
jgi:N-acetylglucosaminyldiphosphoundecaprenol N-acetyl-beta-D-mannosaminyltransferase